MSSAPATGTLTTSEPENTVELSIGGMTCASCAARIEKKLNRMDGVTATVNYATEKAKVSFAEDVSAEDLIATVEATAYSAALPGLADRRGRADNNRTGPGEAAGVRDEVGELRQRLLTTLALTVPVVLLAIVRPLQFTNWQWASLTLAAPVATWGAWPFHRAAWTNLRHAAATMDTLISLGVLAAFGWSLLALRW